MTDSDSKLYTKVKRPLFSTLLLWFLLLALLPLGVSNWINYQLSYQAQVDSAQAMLVKKSDVTNDFIRNWVKHRKLDLVLQAGNINNIELIQSLSKQYRSQKNSLQTFIKTPIWHEVVVPKRSSLINLTNRSDYTYDAYLIDLEGNILYSIVQESDLGSNLFEGDLAQTKFARAVSETLQEKTEHFSDLERYAPSKGILSGFMTAPMLDQQRNIVGVLALQLNLNGIFSKLFAKDKQSSSLMHYLVGQDSILRSPIDGDLGKVMSKEVHSYIIDLAVENGRGYTEHDVYEYTGITASTVLGVSQSVHFENVNWILVSEVDKDEIFASIYKMTNSFIVICFISIVLVLVLAIYQAKRISNPINQLISAVIKVIHGETEQQVKVDVENEIGRLAAAFNVMLSKRLQSDRALQATNESLRNTMLELSGQQYALNQHAIVAITDVQGSIEFVNERFCSISGYSEEELLGNNHRMMSSGVHDPAFFQDMYRTIHDGEVWHGQVCNKRKDGSLYWLETTITPFKDDQGKTQSFIEIRTDITEQKAYDARQQAALAISSIKLNIAKALSESQSFPSRLLISLQHLFELEGFELLNKAALFTYNIESQELQLAVKVGELGDNEAAILADMKEQCSHQIQHPKFIIETSSSLLFIDGDMSGHGHYIVPIKSTPSEENEIGLVGVFYLFTEENAHLSADQKLLLEELVDLFSAAIVRESAKELLKQATISAQQSSQLKSEFLASMSHEIRTPMNGVLGMLGLLQNSGLNDDQLHKANLAKDSAESLLVLINDILDFSKVEAGKLELDIIDFNIYSLFGDCSETMAFKAQDKGLELILDMPMADYTMVKGDPGRIRQILTNIVGNAIKFTEQGEVKITASLTEQANKLCLTCEIEDTGIGIPANKIASLCDSFSQVDASTTRKYGGTGLGLAICKKLCALMDGEITIRSELGKGSCFTFTAMLEASHEGQNTLPSVDINKLTLLIVDDNQTNREVLTGQLQLWGASVAEADSAKEALRLCEDKLAQDNVLFDVAFLDMQMPEMDGAQLGSEIRKRREFDAMGMVMMTSIANQNEAEFFANLGFDAYFPKPATAKDLYDALNVVVDNGEARQKAVPLVTSDYLQTLLPEENNTPFAKAELDKDKVKLLLVEDNIINQQVAIGILAEFGFNVEVAENGQKALQILNESTQVYDLILMDCQMPVLDGYKTTQAIRAGEAGERYQQVSIVAMTANAMQGDREKCLDAGMNDYLRKPIDPNLLESMLYKWLTGSEINDQQAAVNITQVLDDSLDWDQAGALNRVLNKQTLLLDLIDTFKQEMPERIDELKTCVETGNHESIRGVAHTIKGAASNISALKLSSKALELEQSAAKALSEQYFSLYQQIQQAYQALSTNFDQFMESVQADQKNQQDTGILSIEQLNSLLSDILSRLEASEFIESEEITVLLGTTNNQVLHELFETLHAQISMFELTAATETCQQAIALLAQHNEYKAET